MKTYGGAEVQLYLFSCALHGAESSAGRFDSLSWMKRPLYPFVGRLIGPQNPFVAQVHLGSDINNGEIGSVNGRAGEPHPPDATKCYMNRTRVCYDAGNE